MSNEPTSGDYAWSEARDNAEAIKKLEHRLAILEGVCRVAITVDPVAVEEAIKQIKAERDEREKEESARICARETARLPEERRRMREMMARTYPSFGGLFGGHQGKS